MYVSFISKAYNFIHYAIAITQKSFFLTLFSIHYDTCKIFKDYPSNDSRQNDNFPNKYIDTKFNVKKTALYKINCFIQMCIDRQILKLN